MQDYDLKYPGINQQAQTVRRNVAQALSNAHNEANPSKELADFLLDAATKAPGYIKPAPDPLPATETVVGNGKTAVVKDSSGASLAVNATIGVAAGAVTGVTLPATLAAVKTGSVVTVGANTYTFTVAAGKITNVVVAPVA